MPLYLYQGLDTQSTFELMHPMQDAPLRLHPESGEPLRRLYTPPHLGGKHSEETIQSTLSKENLAAKGFTKYEKVKTGQYERTVGTQGPAHLRL
jgi:hypothetical protein